MKTLLLSLSVLLALPVQSTEQPQPEFAGKAIGGLVVCVGGYCIYKMVKICQKLFPKEEKNTNAPPDSLTFDGEEYGASWNYEGPGSCMPEEEDSLHQTSHGLATDTYIAKLKVTVGEWGQVTSTISAGRNDGSHSQTWEEFRQEVASHGLVMTGMGDGSKYYSRNRMPCGPESVPISFDESTRAFVHTGSPGRMLTLTIERSTDFRNWSHFLTVKQPLDSGFEVQDLTRFGQMFYRVSVDRQ